MFNPIAGNDAKMRVVHFHRLPGSQGHQLARSLASDVRTVNNGWRLLIFPSKDSFDRLLNDQLKG